MLPLYRKLKTFTTLTPLSLKTFLYCLVHVPLSGVMLNLLGYKSLVSRYCSIGPESHPTAPSAKNQEILSQTLRGFMLALKYLPYCGTCLSRAILVKGVLQKQQIATTLRLGVNCSGKKFLAHAWLESDVGSVAVGRQAAPGFVPFAQIVEVSAVVSRG